MRNLHLYSTLAVTLLLTVSLLASPEPALAQHYLASPGDDRSDARDQRPRDKRFDGGNRRDEYHRDDYRHDNRRRWSPPVARPWYYRPGHRYYGTPRYSYPPHYYYPRERYYYRGDDFLGWLAFTAITLAIIDNLNEQQQREHERALSDALHAPVGETIQWHEDDASGSVRVIREGTSSAGRYCREYTQGITVAGESQQAHGTACRNPDGSWEIIN